MQLSAVSCQKNAALISRMARIEELFSFEFASTRLPARAKIFWTLTKEGPAFRWADPVNN